MTATGVEPATTYFINKHSAIWPNHLTIWPAFLESFYVYDIALRGLQIKKTPYTEISSTGFKESWKSILRKSQLELLNKLIEENAFNFFNSLNANYTKWSNTLKQFVGKLSTNCLSVFDHFVKLALKGLNSIINLVFRWIITS